MRAIYKTVFAVILLFLCVNVMAQPRFGVKAGLNIAKMSMKAEGEKVDDLKSIMSFHVGGTADFAISDMLIFQPGLLISGKGFKIEGELMGSTMTATETPLYIEVPLNLLIVKELGNGEIFGAIGPYLGYGIGGKSKTEWNGDTESESIKWGTDGNEDDLKPLDFGVNIGAGYGLSNGFYAQLGYGMGLANIAPGGDSDNSLKNGVMSVSLGYKFGKK